MGPREARHTSNRTVDKLSATKSPIINRVRDLNVAANDDLAIFPVLFLPCHTE